MSVSLVWCVVILRCVVLADIVNGLMAIPNLIALIGLSTVVVKETKEYYDYLQNRNRLLKVVQK